MRFICPVCKTAGAIPDDNRDGPATQAACHICGTRLSIRPQTGQVDTLFEPDRPAGERLTGTRPGHEASSVLSMSAREKGKRDYPAIAVVAVVLAVLVAAGIYFTLNIDRGSFSKPLQLFSRLADDFSRYSQTIINEFKKVSQPEKKQTRQAQKHARKGYAHYKKNRLNKAREELSKAIEIDPKNPEAFFWRARTFIRMGQYDDAVTDLKSVIDLNPRYSAAYDNLGWLFMRRNKYDESLTYLNRSIELKTDNGWAHYMRGRIYFKKGELQKALQNAKNACKFGFKDGCRDAKRYESRLTEKG